MENTNKNTANLQLLISEKCTEKEKEIIHNYWEYKENVFVNTPKKIKEMYGISQSEMNKIIATHSAISFYMYCKSCNSYENHQVSSKTKYFEISQLNRNKKYSPSFTYGHCELLAKEKASNLRKEEQKKLIQKFNAAIEKKNWNNLETYEREMLEYCLTMDFNQLKRQYGGQLGKTHFIKFIKSLEKIADQNLIILLRNKENNFIYGYQYLPRLSEFKNEIKEIPKKSKSSVEVDPTTNELKFKLTINKNQNHPDSPMYAGTVTFKERIIIEPGVEYIFGVWQRANENLYLTMTPIENLERLPIQSRICDKPIILQ